MRLALDVAQSLAVTEVLEAVQRLGFHLADTLPRPSKALPPLRQGPGALALQAKAQLQDLAVAGREAVQHPEELLAPELAEHDLQGLVRVDVLYEVSQFRVLLVSHRGLERYGLLSGFLYLSHLAGSHPQCIGDLRHAWLAAALLEEFPLDAIELVHGLDGVRRP